MDEQIVDEELADDETQGVTVPDGGSRWFDKGWSKVDLGAILVCGLFVGWILWTLLTVV